MTDICASRHRGSLESNRAFDSIAGRLPVARARVLAEIQRAGAHGLSAKELAAKWEVGFNTISGRFSELKRDSRIVKIGVRDASAVYVEGRAL